MKHKKILLLMLAVCLSGLMPIETFAQNNMPGEMYDLTRMREGVRNRRASSYDRSGNNRDHLKPIKPGETTVLADIKGSGVINHIWITMSPGPRELSRNDIILRMYWDGNDFPSVESPIGPFFGQGWNEQYNYASYPLTSGPNGGTGLCSYFAMPFAKGARIEIENQTDKEIGAFYYYIDYVEMKELPKDVGRFHAWFNREITEALPEGETEWGSVGKQTENLDGARNYVFADIKGKGHFVGLNYYVQCPTPMWYGEGDDMWFIDGEKQASLLGTGTEDLFNTAWCPKEVYTHPFFGYPRVNNDIGFLGRTHVYRFFIPDPVFFDTGLKATIESGHNNCLTLDIATVAYWYQDKAYAVPAIPNKEGRKLKPLINNVMIHKWRHEWRKNKGGAADLWGNEQ